MSTEAHIGDLWRRLEAWAAEHAPAMLAGLRPGADPAALDELAARCRLDLPAALRASLAVHDGERDDAAGRVWPGAGRLLSTDAIRVHWGRSLDFAEEPDPEEAAELLAAGLYEVIDGPVHAVFFREAWLPILDRSGDRSWYLDFDPPPGGKPGQVIEVDPACTT